MSQPIRLMPKTPPRSSSGVQPSRVVRRTSSLGNRLEVLGDARGASFAKRFLDEIASLLRGDLESCVVIDLRDMDGVMPLDAWRSLKNLCDRRMTRLGVLATAVQLARDTQLQLAAMSWGSEFRVFHTELAADAWAASTPLPAVRAGVFAR